MKKIISLFTLTFLLFSFVIGQDEELEQVPESAIEKSQREKKSDADNWSLYKYENDTLEVLLPSKPTYEAEPIKNAGLNTTLHSYTSEYKNQFYLFSYMKFDDGLDFSDVTASLYAGWIEGVKESFKGANIKNQKGEFLKTDAMILDFEGDTFKGKGVGVLINGIMLQMVMLQIKDADVFETDFYKRSLNKFFSSVKVRKKLEKELADRAIVNNTFKSDLYKFEITLPNGWYEMSENQTGNVRNRALNDKTVNREGKKNLRKSFNNSSFLFRLTRKKLGRKNNASFLSVVEAIPRTRVSTRLIAQATQANFKNNMGYQIVSSARRTYLGGRVFYLIKIKKTSLGRTVYQNIYLRKINSRQILQFGLTYSNVSELEVMDKSLKTLKFFK